MLRAWLLIVAAAGCGSRDEMRGRAWASGDRTAYVHEDDGALVAVRGSVKHRFAIGTGCLADRADSLFLTDDGRRAVALSWRATGGSIHHNVHHERSVACSLELDTGATRALAEVYPGIDLGDDPSEGGVWWIGGRTGWIYRGKIVSAHDDVYDGKGAAAALASPLGNSACDIVERADAIVVACARYLQTSVTKPVTYRYWVDLATYDPAAFPPRQLAHREVEVKRADQVRLSRDGNRVAWWHVPFETGSFGGILEVPGGTTTATFDGARIADVDFDPTGTAVAIVEDGSTPTQVRVLDIAGPGLAERERARVRTEASRVYWLADGRILVSGYARSVFHTPAARHTE